MPQNSQILDFSSKRCDHFKVQKIPPQQTQKMVLYIRHTCIVNLHDGKFIIMKNIHAM